MTDVEAMINSVTPAEATAVVCMRGDLLSEYDDLIEKLDRLDEWKSDSLSDEDPRIPLRARLNELHDLMQASSQAFRYKAIGDKASSDLLLKHASDDPTLQFNPQTYPVALIAASCIDPVMTEEQVGRLFDKLNLAQRNEIYGGAWRANNRQVDIPFFAAASEPAASTE